MKLFNSLYVILLALLLSACKVELVVEDEEDDIVRITVDSHYRSNLVDSNQQYDLYFVDSERVLTAKGNLRKVIVTGDTNVLFIQEDKAIESLTLSGSKNQIFEEDVEIVVDRIELSGNSNILTITGCNSLLDSGEGNQIILMSGDDCAEIVD